MSNAFSGRKRSRRSLPTTPQARMLVKSYDRDTEFTRDVQRMSRQGWNLTSFGSVQPCDSLGLIRASGPGMVPAPARVRIEARFACRTPHQPEIAAKTGRLRGIAVLLKRVAPGAVVHQNRDRSCGDPACC